MGRKSDLTVVQKTVIETLHLEGKSQRVIATRAGCSQSAVCRHLSKQSKGREKCGRKRCTSKRDDRKLNIIIKQNRFKNVPELQKQWARSGAKETVSRTTTFRRVKELGYKSCIPCVKPLLNKKQCAKRLAWAKEKKNWTVGQWSKVMFSDESKFCISFGYQGPRVWRKSSERHNPSCLKSSVKFPQSVMIWGAMSSAGVGVMCTLKTTVNAAVYQEILEHFMLSSADMLYEDADFIFQQDLAPAHSARTTVKWFSDHNIRVLDWPANSPDLNPIENLWGLLKQKVARIRPSNTDELKCAITTAWAVITPDECHRLVASMPRRIEAVIKAKGAATKY